MANLISVRLSKGDSSSWGFRLQGGKDFGTPLIIQKINSGSPAERAGLRAGDAVIKINNTDVFNLRHKDAQDVILRAGPSFDIAVQRGGLTWKPAVSPVGSVTSPRPAQPVNNLSPVTATSLAAGRQENIGAIGTGHNIAAKPFCTVNGGPTLVNKQYNSPLGLYSDQSIAETLSAQSEVLSNGVVGVNFKKNEKSYDSSHSAVFRMVQEADKEPKDYYEPEVDTSSSGVVTAPLGIAGLRHVQAPENKPAPPPQQLPPGQNVCADCERLIVGVFVRIKDKNLHVECFKCATCGSSLKNVGYYNINNKLYCDVHAKLAVKNNPPAPNLVPVTVQPGGKIPSGTISAALASHQLPSSGPLSPNPSYTPVYQPIARPYSSGISAPISPTNSLPKYSTSPATSQAEPRCVQNTIWPPPPKEPEYPTASPLYFPPPSQVHIAQKPLKTEEPEYSETDDMSYKTAFGSMEILNITSGRSVIESSETVSEKIDTQMLVDSVLKSKKTLQAGSNLSSHNVSVTKQPPEATTTKPGDVAVSFTISETELKHGFHKECDDESKGTTKQKPHQPCVKQYNDKVQQSQSLSISENRISKNLENKITLKQEEHLQKQEQYENKACLKQEQTQSIASIYEKAIKVENSVPHKWESPMVVALTTAPDIPISQTASTPDSFLPLPPKRSTSALAAALAVAPAEPFTPVPHLSLEPVPLPEYTEPYFPPEHPIVIEPKQPNEEEKQSSNAGQDSNKVKPKKPFTNKGKKKDEDEILKELPKPTEKISMLAALTTAPDRPYSPFSQHEIITVSEEKHEIVQEESVNTPPKVEPSLPKQKVFPKPEPCAAVFTAPERLYSPFTANRVSYDTEVLEVKESSKNTSSEQHSIEKHQTKNIDTTESVTNISTGCPPLIHCIRSSFETKTDKVHMEMSCAFPSEPVTTTRVVEKKTDITEEKSVSDKKSSHQKHEEIQLQKNVKTVEQLVPEVTKEEQGAKNVQPTQTLTATNKQHTEVVSFSQEKREDITENTLIQQACSRIQNLGHSEQKHDASIKERVTVIQPGQTNLSIPQIAFQPVNEDFKATTAYSSRPRPVTPSMINKPASALPYYQVNLVATPQPPAEGSIYDPKSPAPSRSPSPYLGRSASPFPSSAGRAVSPAPGPPPNPLKSNTPVSTIIRDSKVDQARSYVQSYLPHHQNTTSTSSASNRTSVYQEKNVIGTSHQQLHNKVDAKHSEGFCGSSRLNQLAYSKELAYEKVNSAKETLQASGDSTIQVQRKKVITEEYEHSQNSKQLEKHTNTAQISVTEKSSNLGSAGMHVTNPQPLKSPFIETLKPVQTNIPDKPVVACKLTKAAPVPKISSNVNVKPNVSQPNAGTGGGRQTGAVGVAPKRGRGVLNLAATPGSRVPLCGHCHAHIRGPFITALGKIWCPEHFSCATPACRRALQDLGFVEEQGQLYCEFCFEKYLAPNCAKCSTKVKGDCLKAIGKTFHPECFNCAYCGKLFGNSPFFLEDGQPYCENDWNELFTTKCFACGFPVEAGDRWVEALNNNYHSQCFNCTMCKKNLEGQSFFAKGGRPFCKNHAR